MIAELQEQEGGKGVDLRVATFALFGMMNWIYTWYQPKRDLPLPQLIEQMLRIYFFGLLKAGTVDGGMVQIKLPLPRKKTVFPLA